MLEDSKWDFKLAHNLWEGGLAWYDSWFGTRRPRVQFPPLPLNLKLFLKLNDQKRENFLLKEIRPEDY